MKLSELISHLNEIKTQHGDLTVVNIVNGYLGVIRETPPMVYRAGRINWAELAKDKIPAEDKVVCL